MLQDNNTLELNTGGKYALVFLLKSCLFTFSQRKPLKACLSSHKHILFAHTDALTTITQSLCLRKHNHAKT